MGGKSGTVGDNIKESNIYIDKIHGVCSLYYIITWQSRPNKMNYIKVQSRYNVVYSLKNNSDLL